MNAWRHPISLAELLSEAGIDPVDLRGNPAAVVTGISTHAQSVARNEMFVAIAGTRIDSHMLLHEAVAAGAAVLVVERDVQPHPGITIVRVADTRRVLGPLAHAFYRHPARAMNVCGVTGTNGKSTVAHLVYSILRTAGVRPGVIGTLGARFGEKSIELNNTTPGAVELAEIFHRMDDERVDYVVMECSSHAIDQGRIDAIPFRCAAITNMSQDHLDYHKTFGEYVRTKKRLFTEYAFRTPGSLSCFNLDDAVGRELAQEYAGDFVTFSSSADAGATIWAENTLASAEGTTFTLHLDGGRHRVSSRLCGEFNLSNMLAAASCAHSMGVDGGTIARGLEEAPPVPGRFEFIREGQPFSVVVDYAHTPDALMRLLKTARRVCANRLITVFGCGGDRDRAKRPMMGRAVGDLADYAIITSDNPRTEDPASIARMVQEGILQSALKSNRYQVIHDRRQAIERALMIAEPGDVVLIAGKGHETYQEIDNRRTPFDDCEVAREVLAAIAGNRAQGAECETLAERMT